MAPARLRLKIIKDATLEPDDGSPAAARPELRALDMAMLPFTVYLRIDLPGGALADQPLFLHLLGRPGADGRPNSLFIAIRVPEATAPVAAAEARRVLLVIAGEAIPNGRYRLAMVSDRRHIAFVDLVKRPDQLRVLGPATPGPPAPAISPVLISGTHKSGTTWLEKVIDAHPDFIVLHEANTFNILDAGELRRLVAARREHFQHKNYIRWLNPEFDVGDFSRFLQIGLARELMMRLGRAWGTRYVADRTPGYSGLYPHLPRFWAELRILHIVRHPLDVLVSRLFHEANLDRSATQRADIARPMLEALNARLDAGEAVQPGTFISDADAAGPTLQGLLADWRRDQDNYLTAARATPGWMHLIKYEDLLGDFSAEAARMFAFIGTDPKRTDIARIASRTTFETLSGGRSAGQADARSFFRKGVAGDWRNLFSTTQARTLWDPVTRTATEFGYSVD